MSALTLSTVLAGIAFDPTIRGILATGVGVVVLIGSSYLLLGTNVGNRLGFLLAMTGFFGWMAVMGMSWWIYGIGMQGDAPTWHVVEYVGGDPAQAGTDPVRDLDLSLLPQTGSGPDYDGVTDLSEEDPDAFRELDEEFDRNTGGWQFLPPSDASRAEAEAVVNAELPACTQCPFGITEVDQFKILGAFETGGKAGLPLAPSIWDRVSTRIGQTLQLTHPDHYAVVQVQKVIEQEPEPGEAPPPPVVDEDEPVVSIVMIRDIGDKRLPSAMITVGSTLIFLLMCWVLHQRESILEANLAAAEAAGKA